MKWFLTVAALAGVIGVMGASCGPQRDFCPTTNPDPTDLICHPNNDAMGGQGGQDQGPCDGGTQYACPGGIQCKPCGT